MNFSFQVDSEIVKGVYQNHDNYLIEYSFGVSKEYCIIYFSSNDIYFPNTEDVFRKEIIKKTRFEWYGIRVKSGYKHIFIRDIYKQYYLNGINNNLNSINKLLCFLKVETEGYKVITVGSSAGGFPSVLFGQLLNAEKIYSFNGLFEIRSKLSTSTENINPIIFREKDNPQINQYFNIIPYIQKPSSIYYFCSTYSSTDAVQSNFVKNIPINVLKFKTSHHGIPFLKSSLKYILNMNNQDLDRFANKEYKPFLFSLKLEGIQAFINLIILLLKSIKKKYFR